MGILIIGGVTIGFADKIHQKPADFTATPEQRKFFYPNNWYFSGGFTTLWEMTDYDGEYAYFDYSVSHTYEVHFSTEIINSTHVLFTFKPVQYDENSVYGWWFFNITIYDLQGSTELAFVYDYWNVSRPVILPELEGYKIVLDVAYVYFACTVTSGDSCLNSNWVLETYTRVSYLDYSIIAWNEIHEGFVQFLYILFFSLTALPFIAEFIMNFKERNKLYRILIGLIDGFIIGVAAEEWIKVIQTLSSNKEDNFSYRGLSANLILMGIALVTYTIVQFLEFRRAFIKEQKISQPTPSYQVLSGSVEEHPLEPEIYKGRIPQEEITKKDFKTCSKCGAKLELDSRFCTECGAKISAK
ncbi:MAG: zinc ribbon domain-containing protein [Candidatus Heimdallarchaeaceae archaeon]